IERHDANTWDAKVRPLFSSLALRLEHRRYESFPAFLTRPDHELEGLVIALAAFERCFEHRFALGDCRHRPVEQQGVAEHHESLLRPQLEVAKPQLLVD